MITISRKQSNVIVKIQYGIDGWYTERELQFANELAAILHEKQLRENLQSTIEKIRRDAYNLGWKDAKSKKVAKKKWFNSNINSEFV